MDKKILAIFAIFFIIGLAYSTSSEMKSVSLVSRPGILDMERVEEVFLTEGNYEPVKEMLGLEKYEFFMEISEFRIAPGGDPASGDGLMSITPGDTETEYALIFGKLPDSTEEEILYGQETEGETINSIRGSPTFIVDVSRVMFFDRFVLYQANEGYRIARVSLGVWI